MKCKKALFLIIGIFILIFATPAHCIQEAYEIPKQVPEHLRFIFVDSPLHITMRHPSEIINRVTKAGLDTLVKLYPELKKEKDKRTLVFALASVGDEDTVKFLKDILSYDYKGKFLTDDEERTLLFIPLALGTLAQQYDSAYSFIMEGTDPLFWKTKKSWTSERGTYSIDMLTSFSIQAVGISARPDVPTVLKTLKNKKQNYLYRFAGDVTQAAFYYHLIQNKDKYLSCREEYDKQFFTEWIKTPKGSEWLKWADDKMRGPSPKE